MSYVLHHGDCLDELRKLEPNSVDAIVTDPPYGLRFMGKRWDYDVPSVETWQEALRVAKPGAYLLAFGGTRTHHRMMVAIEDAGWEIRDVVMWLYGSGFPKSHNLSGEWDGWGTALKPAYEPVIMARKPLQGTVAANVLEWGTGAINVDGCRVGTDDVLIHGGPLKTNSGDTRKGKALGMFQNGTPNTYVQHASGRWPANIIHDGSEEVIRLFPESNARPAKAALDGTGSGSKKTLSIGWGMKSVAMVGYTDTGSAARFFYTAKASKRDRDEGLEGFELRVASVGNLDAAGRDPTNSNNYYGEGARRRVENGELPSIPRANHHPTVKPTSLMQYLCRLVTPPNGIILDPFMGSGSTGKAAMYEGFRFIGIEREAEYIEIARARIEYARKQAAQTDLPLLAMAAD